MLDGEDVAQPVDHAGLWEKVIRKLRAGQMPPGGMPRPEPAALTELAAYLEAALDRAAAQSPNPGRPTAIHRLNRAEYSNAIRDLLGLEIDSQSLLPTDSADHGFDNNGEVLSLSPVLMERYMIAGGRISRLAIGDPVFRPVAETYSVSRGLIQESRMSEQLPFGSRGGLAVSHRFPLDGEYIIRITLQRDEQGYIKGLREPHLMDVRQELLHFSWQPRQPTFISCRCWLKVEPIHAPFQKT